jgi:hypothetical protein
VLVESIELDAEHRNCMLPLADRSGAAISGI